MKFTSICIVLALWIEPSTQEVFSKGSKGKGKTSAPTVSPAPSICQDNPGRFLVPGTGGNDMRLCDWVNRKPGDQEYPWRCRDYPEAVANCPVSCGTCPGATSSPSGMPSALPSPGPTSMPTASPSGRPSASPSDSPSAAPSPFPSARPTSSPSASPTGEPSASFMPTVGPSIAPTSGPSSTPSVSPTYTPSSAPTCPPSKKGGKGKGCQAPSPPPSSAPVECQDITGRFPVNGVTQACVWVINGGGASTGLPWRCADFPEARANCPFTCGDCGCVDTTERFNVAGTTGGTKSCEWVARTTTTYRCGLDNVRFLCPATCDNCP